jgi:hypothetical protein
MQANSIATSHLQADAVKAGNIDVTSLSAISATLGDVDISSAHIGTLTVDRSNIQASGITDAVSSSGGIGTGGRMYATIGHPDSDVKLLVIANFHKQGGGSSQQDNAVQLRNETTNTILRSQTVQNITDAYLTWHVMVYPAAGVTTTQISLYNVSGNFNLDNAGLSVIAMKR